MERESDLTVAGLAHDLNNVFETIGEAADLLASDPKWVKLAATIQRSVERGSRIVESFSESVCEALDLDKILDNAIQHATDFLRATHSAELRFQRDVESGLRLPGPPACWERVFVNLFLNTAQVMPHDAELEIRARRGESETEIVVTDNGPGIPEQILPQIFEPHVSTKKPRSKNTRAGLGLHIVQTIVCQHGGSVTAGNRDDGAGARFRIALPAEARPDGSPRC